MALDRYIPTLKALKEGDKSVSLTDLQDELRKAWEAIHFLEGRLGPVTILDDVDVQGDLNADDLNAERELSFGDFLTINERPITPGTGATAPEVSVSGSSRIYMDTSSGTVKMSENGGAYQDLLSPPAATVYGRWLQTATVAGPASYTWDTEVDNTGEFVRQAGNTQIVVNFTGHVLVAGNFTIAAMVSDAGVEIFKNASKQATVYMAIGSVSNVSGGAASIVIPVTSGDFLEFVMSQAFTLFGDATGRYTVISLTKVGS